MYSHPGVGAVIIAPDGRYLMQLRDRKPDLLYPDYLCLFGGALEPGEEPEEGLLRELGEELDFMPRAWSYLADLVYPRLSRTGLEYDRESYFVIAATMDEIASMRLGEGAAMLLLPLAEIRIREKVMPAHLCALLYHSSGVLARPPFLD